MNAKKKRDKNRRRARKLAEQAWDAADEGNYDLAAKIIRRAVDYDPGNPVIWNDQGLILRQLDEYELAAEAFQAAISLAADYAEAYANLADIRVREGNAQQAVVLGREAVRHAPPIERYRDSLRMYEALADVRSARVSDPDEMSDRRSPETHGDLRSSQVARSGDRPQRSSEHALRNEFPELSSRVESLDWRAIEEQLTHVGYAHVRQLLSPERCDKLRAMFDRDPLYSQTVKMNKSRFGKGTYRYFKSPIPKVIDGIRQIVYPYVSQIANVWQQLIGQSEVYPSTWEAFRQCCADAGQAAPTPLMLRYETGGFNALHQDVRGEVYFPIQLVIVLSAFVDQTTTDDEGFTGGEFLFVDQPERKRSDRRTISAGLGDAVLFCTRSRLVKIGGVYGLKSVKHGMDRIQSGTRYALGIPFHEYE